MRGERPLKHPALLAGHRPRRQLVPLEPIPLGPPPPCPAGVLPATIKRWRALWKSRVARVWDRTSDLPVVTRYALLLDRWHRYDELVRTAPMIRGSKDQLRANPLATRMDAIGGQLRALEEQLGLTPAARLRLGLTLVEARTTFDQYLGGADEDDEDAVDPRELLRRDGAP